MKTDIRNIMNLPEPIRDLIGYVEQYLSTAGVLARICLDENPVENAVKVRDEIDELRKRIREVCDIDHAIEIYEAWDDARMATDMAGTERRFGSSQELVEAEMAEATAWNEFRAIAFP